MSIVRLPQPPQEYDPRWATEIVNALELILTQITQPAQTGWTTNNVTTTRTFDANSTTTAEVADVLGTLIEDMKARQYGMLGK